MRDWSCALVLDPSRRVVEGSPEALVSGIRQGGDLRVSTEFLYNEHVDVASRNAERIVEVAEFGVTFLVDDRWVAGVMSLRQPVDLPDGFGLRPSMSFFLYNQDGRQAIARPYLDGAPAAGSLGPSTPDPPPGMPKYHAHDAWDGATRAPSSNFIYDFDAYRFHIGGGWRPVLAHDAAGVVTEGSVQALVEAFGRGAEVKVGVTGLCDALAGPAGPAMPHVVFVQTGSGYYFSDRRFFVAGSHPVVRVKPAIPMRYESRGWDFGWLVARTDGRVVYRRCDPYTLSFDDIVMRRAVRWFVRC